MSPTLNAQIEQLKNTIQDMEAQRAALGDEVVDTALAPLRLKLDELLALLKAQQAHPPTQQRKLVTLLFMDVVGSTSIAQDMDPEEVRDVFDIALQKLAQPVKEHGGHVTRYMGDGFLAVFGAPVAHENDPEQAIRAGLKIIGSAEELAPELRTEWDIANFQVRVGINTGLVALGGLTEAEDTLMGAAVNLAARLESAAPPGCLLISHDTYRHVRGLFDLESRDPILAKGFNDPVQVYRVLRLKPRTFRTYTRGVEGVETRMVGRQTELKYLQDALLTAIEESEGQMITITGAAGVGKSRLLYEFQNWIDLLSQQVRFFEGRGRVELQNRPYGLLRDMFEFRFQIQDNQRASAARQKLVDGLMEVFGSTHDGEMRAHLLGHMLGFDFSQSHHLRGVVGDPEQLRNRGWMYLKEFFQELGNQNPVVIFMEDVHWADDSSLDALSRLVERMKQLRLLIICAARPTLLERRPYWGEGFVFHHRLELGALSKRSSQELVGEIFKRADHLPIDVRDLLVENAEGNPFYLEELSKMLVEDGVILIGEQSWRILPERLVNINVPPTLAGVLQARLDSLPPEEKIVLQQASVVGRQFWDRAVAYIQASGEGDPHIVQPALASLRAREFVYRRENSSIKDSHEFIFKHNILREVTYESVLKRLRKIFHGLVADWLIAQGAERIDEYSGLIAGHLLQAGRVDRAVEYFLRAGNAALETYANTEAEASFREALAHSPVDTQRAVGLAGLGEALRRHGRSEEAGETLGQAIELLIDLADQDHAAQSFARLSQVLWSQYLDQAWEVCQEGLARLDKNIDSPGMAQLLSEAGRISFYSFRPSDEVETLCQGAIEMAGRLGELEVSADTLLTLAILEMRNNHLENSIAISEEVIELAEANSLYRLASRAHNNLGIIYDKLLDPSSFIEHTRQAIETSKKINEDSFSSIGNLIEGYIRIGNINEAERTFDAEFLNNDSASSWEEQYCSLTSRMRIQYARGDWHAALETQERCVDLVSSSGSVIFIVNRYLELAIILTELDRFGLKSDLSKAENFLKVNLEPKFRYYEFCCLLSTLLARLGKFADAADWLVKAGDPPGESGDYIVFVSKESTEFELAYAQGRWEQAVTASEAQVNLFKNHGLRWGWARRLIDLGDALMGRDLTGDREEAERAYRQSLQLFTEMEAPGYVQVLEKRLQELEDGTI